VRREKPKLFSTRCITEVIRCLIEVKHSTEVEYSGGKITEAVLPPMFNRS